MIKDKIKSISVKLAAHKKVLIIVGSAVLASVLVFGAVFTVVHHYLGRINRSGEDIETIPPELEDFETDAPAFPEDTGVSLSPEETSAVMTNIVAPDKIEWNDIAAIGDDHVLNIMLVGQDRRPGEGRARSDVMILCSINADLGKVSFISFLRDLYVQIPGGYSDNRLNVAYYYGGFPLLYETMYVNFGITIDGGIEVDFEGFTELIDLLGGVDVELSGNEAWAIGDGTVSGMNRLNGEQALKYARLRSIDNDFNRTARQRVILEAVFEKFSNSDLPTALSFLNEALPLLTTDMTNTELVNLAVVLVPMANTMEVSSYMVPTTDCYSFASVRGMSVLIPDLDKIREHLENEYLPLGE